MESEIMKVHSATYYDVQAPHSHVRNKHIVYDYRSRAREKGNRFYNNFNRKFIELQSTLEFGFYKNFGMNYRQKEKQDCETAWKYAEGKTK